MAVAYHQEVICDLLISFLKLYFGQIAVVSCKSDYLTSKLATFLFHNTATSASIPNIYSKDTWRQSINLEFIMMITISNSSSYVPYMYYTTCVKLFLLGISIKKIVSIQVFNYQWM